MENIPMSKLFSPYHPHLTLSLFAMLAITLFCGHEIAAAANSVSGRYLSAEGTKVILSLSIQNPSPANLIVEQYFSPGNKIVATSPRAKKVDNAKCKAKWLFRNTRSGNITLSIQLKAPLTGRPSAMVRYRDPAGGSFKELRISP
jgi:hypothetical protein